MVNNVYRRSFSYTSMLTVDCRIKVHMNVQADKSSVVVKGPFFPKVWEPKVLNPWNNVQRKDSIQQSKESYLLKNQIASNLWDHQENTSNLIY
jgi:hypothetical protein